MYSDGTRMNVFTLIKFGKQLYSGKLRIHTNPNLKCTILGFKRQSLLAYSFRSYSSRTVQEFYDKSNVFITGEHTCIIAFQIIIKNYLGGSGFLGKSIIEKLLISCGGVKNIYILMRPKKGQSIENRFECYLKDQVFNRVRSLNPALMNKLKYVAGDVTEPNLGISAENYRLLQENVNVVFHSAASIKFNDPFKDALNMNALGTNRCLELASDMPHLKVTTLKYYD
jgi:fatty acyl-CoA reductase